MKQRALTTITLVVTLFLGAGCATAPADAEGKIVEPEITIMPVEVPRSAGRATQFQTVVRVEVENRDPDPITVERLDVSTVGTAAFSIAPTEATLQEVIPPGGRTILSVWAPAATIAQSDETLARGEGDLMVRAIVRYTGTDGRAGRRVVAQRVGTSISTR